MSKRRWAQCSSTTRTCSRSATKRWPASSRAHVPGSAVVRHIVMFGRVLREAGLEVGPGRVADALRGLDAVELESREDVYWTLRQTLVSRREDLEAFDLAFEAWFLRAPSERRLRTVEAPPRRGAQREGGKPGPGPAGDRRERGVGGGEARGRRPQGE